MLLVFAWLVLSIGNTVRIYSVYLLKQFRSLLLPAVVLLFPLTLAGQFPEQELLRVKFLPNHLAKLQFPYLVNLVWFSTFTVPVSQTYLKTCSAYKTSLIPGRYLWFLLVPNLLWNYFLPRLLRWQFLQSKCRCSKHPVLWTESTKVWFSLPTFS